MKIESTKQFSTVLGGVSRSAKSQRDNIQALLIFGFVHYETHGATEYLNRVVDCSVKTKVLSTGQLKKYVKGHTNLKFGVMKDGKEGFSVGNKKADRVTLPDVTWYEYEKATADRKASDTLAQLENFIKRIESSLDSDLGVANKDETAVILKGLKIIKLKVEQPVLVQAA